MEQRPFGHTGLNVSVIGFGGAAIWHAPGEKGGVGDDEVDALLNAMLDSGVTLIDTAGMYGLSEERIGRAIAHRRSEFVLSSKCGFDRDESEDWSAEAITAGIDRSLKYLKTDRIDIMHLHSCDMQVLRQGEAIAALHKAVEAGKVRFAAYSGDNEELLWAVESGHFAGIQTSLNICDQRCLDRALPHCHLNGLGVIVKRPLANAFWRFADRPRGEYCEEYWVRARAMNLRPDPLPWDEFFLRFAAFQSGVCSIIIGTRRVEHFRRNVELLRKGPLPPEQVAALRELFKRHDHGWTGQI